MSANVKITYRSNWTFQIVPAHFSGTYIMNTDNFCIYTGKIIKISVILAEIGKKNQIFFFFNSSKHTILFTDKRKRRI